MKGKALAASALVVMALAASAFAAGYIERFDYDETGFGAYGGGASGTTGVWTPTGGSTGGTTEGNINGVGTINVMMNRSQNDGDAVDNFAGPHFGEAIVIDIKGSLPSYKRGLVIRVETDEDPFRAWLGTVAFQGVAPVDIGDGQTWVRCILPLNPAAMIPVDLTGGTGVGQAAWSRWPDMTTNLVNDSLQDDLNYVFEKTIRFVIEHPGGVTFMDNVGFTYAGDANGDGVVGIADLVALAGNYGADDPNTVGWMQGDFNTDFQVGIADLVALADNYGMKTGDLLPVVVPEPATLLLIAGGAVAGLLRRRR